MVGAQARPINPVNESQSIAEYDPRVAAADMMDDPVILTTRQRLSRSTTQLMRRRVPIGARILQWNPAAT
jgi:hypothetical protein